MPTPCRRSGRRMGSAHILDLCSFPSHLLVFKYIALNFLVVCRSSSICSSNQSFGSIQLCIVILCPSPSAAYSVSTCSLCTIAPYPTTCVLFLVLHLFVCFISGSHQASVAVLQIWKDGVVKYPSSSQVFEVEKSVF